MLFVCLAIVVDELLGSTTESVFGRKSSISAVFRIRVIGDDVGFGNSKLRSTIFIW